MQSLVKIELSEADARLFIAFQKRYAFTKLLEEMGAFDIKNGSIEVHFGNMGEIAKIDIHSHYRLPVN